VTLCPSTGKRAFARYGEALAHLEGIERDVENGRMRGSIYTCVECGQFHVTSRLFTVWRKKGRGKSRRNLVKGA
jgi:hypothetical protein